MQWIAPPPQPAPRTRHKAANSLLIPEALRATLHGNGPLALNLHLRRGRTPRFPEIPAMVSIRPFEPAVPFTSWPLQFRHPDVGFAWYLGQGTLVTQINNARGTTLMANVIGDWIDSVLDTHHADIEKEGGLLAIHDWRRIKTYDKEARVVWFSRIQQRRQNYLRKAVVILGDNPLLRMAVAGGNLLITMGSRGEGHIEITTNAHEVLRKYNIRAPER